MAVLFGLLVEIGRNNVCILPILGIGVYIVQSKVSGSLYYLYSARLKALSRWL